MKKFISTVFVSLIAASLFAVTSSQIPTGTGTSGPLPAMYAGQAYRLQGAFDATVTAIVANTTNTTIQIPSNTVVLGVGYVVDQVEDSTCAVTIGDSSDYDGWIASVQWTNLCTSSGFSTPVLGVGGLATNVTSITVTPALALGKVYATGGQITTTFASACDKLKATVYAICVPLTP